MPRPGSIVLYSEPHSPRFDGVPAAEPDEEQGLGERPAIVNAVTGGVVELTVFTPYGASVRHNVVKAEWRWPGPDIEDAKVPESVRDQLRDGSWPATVGDPAKGLEVQSAKPADPVKFPSHATMAPSEGIGEDQAEAVTAPEPAAEHEAAQDGQEEVPEKYPDVFESPAEGEGEKFPEPPAPEPA